ncbi:hypothetical protein SAMN05421807_103152 [Virgibacillus chiguensis]|uniref:Uncharacterized protein n=1 Tax=Virgibacillus chiguensis TaxID=411959 RepID=A0A1M5PPE1_9BACI|nr:hypothetical protein SAMN05421807_103152 [Virgibacillus chiguensis]
MMKKQLFQTTTNQYTYYFVASSGVCLTINL